MRAAIATCLLLAKLSAAVAGPADEAQLVVERWLKAFSDSDVDAIVKLYAPDAVFLGTGSKTVVMQSAEIRQYFEQALNTNRPRGASVLVHKTQVLSDDVVVITALDEVTGVRDGTKFASPGRDTFVLAKREGQWRVVTFHRSAVPK